MPSVVHAPDFSWQFAELEDQVRRLSRGTAASQRLLWEYDTFTITGVGDTTHGLTWLPYGINVVMLNGLGLVEGTDYTCNYTTGVVTVTATLTAGDVLHVRYVTTGELKAYSLPPNLGDISDTFNRANSTTSINPASDGGTWTDERNAWGITSNTGYVHGDSGTGNLWDFSGLVIHRNLGSAVQTVQVDVNRAVAGTGNSRLYWALATGSPGSAYMLNWSVGNDFHLVKAYSNGTGTTLGGPWTCGFSMLAGWHTVKVTYDGAGHCTFAVDGAAPFQTYTDTSPLTGTRVGIGQFQLDTGTNFTYDNFSASPS